MELEAKKKHRSRKLKSSWRKYVDLKDVENFLDEQREDERVTGKIEQTSNEELFLVDVKPDENLVRLSDKQRKKLKAQEAARCFAALENTSKITDPIIKRNRVKTKEERKHPLVRQKEALRNIKKSKKSEPFLENDKKLDKKQKSNLKFDRDIWSEDKVPKDFQVEWYNKNLIEHNLKSLGTPLVRPPGEVHVKRSKLEAVQAPHPGISYNPTFDDHNELMSQVITKEEEIIKREQHIDRVVTKKFTKMSAAEVEKLRRMEMVQGLPMDQSKENQENAEETDDEYHTVNPPARNKKKDRRQRRKQLEARQRRAMEENKQQELKKIKDINKVPILKVEIKKQENQVQKKRKNHENRLKEKKLSAHRISRRRYKEPEITVNTLEDITGSMRSLKPEGNLLLERFKSLQKRNILPSGVLRKPRRKTMIKKYIKQSHKGEGIQTKNKIKPPKSSR